MSKPGTTRWRYVAFELDGPPVGRHPVKESLKKAGVPRLELTRFGFPHGIARAPHTHAAALRRAIESMELPDTAVRCLLTSGTIRTLTRKLGILRQVRKGIKPELRGTLTRKPPETS